MKNELTNTQRAINEAVIRNDTGKYVVRQCKSILHTETVKTQTTKAFNDKTVGDILNRLQMNNNTRRMILQKD